MIHMEPRATASCPFSVDALDTRGRVVKLGATIDAVIGRHAYPESVSRLLAEAAALTVLLGASLKIEGRFQLQTKTDGPVSMIVVDFRWPDSFRAYARFDEKKIAALPKEKQKRRAPSSATGISRSPSIPPDGDRARYQGLVALEGQSLEEAAHHYFTQSEQIPTRVRLAAGELYVPGAGGERPWRRPIMGGRRASGAIPAEGERAPKAARSSGRRRAAVL